MISRNDDLRMDERHGQLRSSHTPEVPTGVCDLLFDAVSTTCVLALPFKSCISTSRIVE